MWFHLDLQVFKKNWNQLVSDTKMSFLIPDWNEPINFYLTPDFFLLNKSIIFYLNPDFFVIDFVVN